MIDFVVFAERSELITSSQAAEPKDWVNSISWIGIVRYSELQNGFRKYLGIAVI
jgi:hypothetical protein